MFLIILLLIVALAVTLWLQRIQRLALLLWMTEKDTPLPDEADMGLLVKKVVTYQIRDITGGWSKHS